MMSKNKQELVDKKMYILDTNVLIHDPQALFAFRGAHVGLPITVVQELDHFKTESSQRGRNSREAIRSLDKLRNGGSLADGIHLEDGTVIQVLVIPPEDKIAAELVAAEPDNKILLCALSMKRRNYDVYFISKDLNLRVRADSLGLKTEDYKKETVAEDNFYHGWITIKVPAVELKKGEPKVLQDAIQEHELVVNQFVLLTSQRNNENYKIYRYLGGKTFKLVEVPRMLWPIEPRNPQQLMALDLLFDDSVQFVTLFGPAGTGKTFLALVAALHKLLIDHVYQKLLIARPVVPLGRDIGYLPGDVQEKLYSWMQPVRDNMDFIMHQAEGHGEGIKEELYGKRRNGRHKKDKDRRSRRGHNSSMPSLDDLVRADKISLEAITYMRGRSIPYQFILIDEVQNLTPHEVKTLVTRVGEGSKIILAGDPYQIDSTYLDFSSNGLVVTSERFRGQKIFGTVFLETSERSELSQLAAELLQ